MFDTPSPVLIRSAQVISAVGHPLLTLAIFTILITFRMYDPSKAFLISALIIGLLVVPVTARNYNKYRKKEYTNFDVSDRRQRESFYKFGVILLSAVTVLLYFIPGTKGFFIGTLCSLLMMITSGIVNLKVKASLHTGVTMFLSVIYFMLDTRVAYFLVGFTILIACSRLVLKRHTISEVISGAAIGLVFGLLNNYAQSYAVLN
jgi:membrane-associated phospholipid phosphatase